LKIPQSSIDWAPSYRIISTRFPAIAFFERISADPADRDALIEVEKLTDPFLNVGNLDALEMADRITGAGTGRILSSFTFADPNGTSFTDGTFGAYYAALDLKTAIFETVYHRIKFMSATNEPAQEIDQLLILADVRGVLHDIRDMQSVLGAVYHPDDYSESQKLSVLLRADQSLGIVFKSVRNLSGECIAVWRPRIISNAREDRHITYQWNGKTITGYYDKDGYVRL
jgi:hypothetical protein